MTRKPVKDLAPLVCAIVMTCASLVIVRDSPGTAVWGLVFFGGSTVVLLLQWHGKLFPAPQPPLPRVFVVRHDIEGYQRLLGQLETMSADESTRLLTTIAESVPQIDGLIFHARRGDLDLSWTSGNDPVGCALASLNPDGHVREAAVAAMEQRPLSVYVPFLIERATDWVEPVRTRALALLTRMLAEQPD